MVLFLPFFVPVKVTRPLRSISALRYWASLHRAPVTRHRWVISNTSRLVDLRSTLNKASISSWVRYESSFSSTRSGCTWAKGLVSFHSPSLINLLKTALRCAWSWLTVLGVTPLSSRCWRSRVASTGVIDTARGSPMRSARAFSCEKRRLPSFSDTP